MTPDRRDPAVACLLAGLTGAAALVSQIVWQRYVGRIVGSDAAATALTLGVFLGGLSLGYALFGRATLRVRRPLWVYGLTELAVGAWALGFPLAFAAVDVLAGAARVETTGGRIAHGLVVATVLIGPPTVLMGATMPLLTRGLAATSVAAGRVHALVYAANTAGAALGALLAAFVLLERLGLPGSLRAAAACHLLAGVWFAVARREATAPVPDAAPPPRTRAVRRRAVYAVVALSGAAFMTLETATVRLAGLTFGASVAAFAITVAAFVLAVAGGALIVARRRPGPSGLVTTLALGAAAIAVTFPAIDDLPWAAHRLRLIVPSTDAGFVAFHAGALLLVALVAALPAGALGAALPIAFDAIRGDVRRSGRDSGALFAWNAAGNLVGGVGGGFLLWSVAGLGEIWLLTAACSAAAAVVAAIAAFDRRPVAGVGVATVAVVALWFPSHDPLRFAVGTFRFREPLEFSERGPQGFYRGFFAGRTILRYVDGADATVAVVENPTPEEALARRFPGLASSLRDDLVRAGPRPQAIAIDGKIDSNAWYDRATLRLLGHLPLLLAETPRRVLVVGLGTGVTAGEIALYDDVERIDVAEISAEVDASLPLFAAWTHDVHLDPRLARHRIDAFRLLRSEEAAWDVIVSQPSNPWMGANALLFSREFIGAARERLAPDGVFVQWIQRYETTERLHAIALNTVRDAFPHVRVFRAEADDLVVATNRPLDDDAWDRAARRLAESRAAAESLAELHVGDVAALLALEDRDAFARAAARRDDGIERLDRPRLRGPSARAFFRGDGVAGRPASPR